VGSSIADQATVSGGDSPSGTVTFNLYNNPNATGAPLFTDTEPLSGGSATSASYTTAATGTDYWVATYNGDSNDNPVSSGNADEPVTISAATPSISTSPQPASGTVGSSIADKATLSGGDSPSGTVTFDLYNNPNATGTPLFTDTESLSAGSATSASYKTTAAGTDYWIATYNGDSNNNKVSSGSGSEPVVIVSPPPPVCGAAPAIITQPSDQTVTAPAAGSFSAAGSTPANCGAPSVQWYSEPPGQSGFSPISGATSTSYATPATSVGQSGTKFEAVFANAFGWTTTNPATLTVKVVPSNWTVTGGMNAKRAYADSVVLPNGEVLMMGGATGAGTVIAGSLKTAELYNPVTGKWAATGSMTHARYGFPAVLVADGKVLVVGGFGGGDLSSAELYDPATRKWSLAGSVGAPRDSETATVLKNGKVLVAGGDDDGHILTSAKLYHPATNTWSSTGSMKYAVYGATATRLKDGRVLVTGGRNSNGYPNTVAQLYDPTTGTWSKTAPLPSPRIATTATVLPNGKVLLAGGQKGYYSGFLNTAVLYDPRTGKWSTTGSMADARSGIFAARLLPNGTVLVAGGSNGTTTLASAEIYNPATGRWTRTAPMNTGRRAFGGMATVLRNGKVLVAGGLNARGFLNASELYTP
jgi:N-acetylneuraminic acid mutarotase